MSAHAVDIDAGARYIADDYECADYAEFLRMVDGSEPIDTVTWNHDSEGRLVVRWTPQTRVIPSEVSAP